MDTSFDKWKGVLWKVINGRTYAFCPEHTTRLEVRDGYGNLYEQYQPLGASQSGLVCPVDEASFAITGGTILSMRRRYTAVKESEQFKQATYRDLDNVYTPVLRIAPKPKDKRYSIQVEVDDTPTGKKLVIYAMDRENPPEKTQIFIDPQLDKLSFDATNDLHPNMIFSKVVAYFKDGKTATIEQDNKISKDKPQ